MSDSIYLEKIQKAMNERKDSFEERKRSQMQSPTQASDPNAVTEPPPVTEQQQRNELDIISRGSIHTDLSKAVSNVFHGVNMLGYRAPIPINKDQYGLTLFTKPRFRLHDDNLVRDRKLAQLMTEDSSSYAAAIRAYLDPVGQSRKQFSSLGVDSKNCFIPLLTNTIETLSGWPDIVMDTYNAPEGVRKQTWMMYDGVVNIHSRYTLSASFKNITRDPVTWLFDTWLRYGSLEREGEVVPYYTNIFYREIDYQTRVWRVVLNEQRTHVTKIAACYAAEPISISIGQHFNFNSEAPFNQENASINIQFECVGADYNDPILIDEFNDLVCMFNPSMRDGEREIVYKKLSGDANQGISQNSVTSLFNYLTYLRIDPDTYELEQWVDYETYYSILGED